jgi:hypothetical protein
MISASVVLAVAKLLIAPETNTRGNAASAGDAVRWDVLTATGEGKSPVQPVGEAAGFWSITQ